MQDSELSIEELIASETEKRLNEMGQPGYEFPKQITKADWIAMGIGVAVSFLLILLCMTGVIR